MKKTMQNYILFLPLAAWMVITPVIVKLRLYPNPLMDTSWYTALDQLSDFFLYYKSVFVTILGVVMAIILMVQFSDRKNRRCIKGSECHIFIPILLYLIFVVLSSVFSSYRYFCINGMPDQFETLWNQLAYVIALFYAYYCIRHRQSEQGILTCIFIGAALVGAICVLQYFKFDIYRMIYSGEGFTFTFEEGTVYGSFYNINYVGYYTLLFVPLFVMLAMFLKDLKIRILAVVLTVALMIALVGAKSMTAIFALGCVAVFAAIFFIFKLVSSKKGLCILTGAVVLAGIVLCVLLSPRFFQYIRSTDTEKTNLQNIYTRDDHVEIDYKGSKLFIKMFMLDSGVSFEIKDQDQTDVACEYQISGTGYGYYAIQDSRFSGITVTPALLSQEPQIYGFVVFIDDKDWSFTNQMTPDGTYYHFTNQKKLAKLSEENVSEDFRPLVSMSNLASGRGYIWNKTIALLKNYIFLGSGADTFALVYPNDDYVDIYNNGYDNMIVTKPHNLYLQIATQSGVLSMICFLVFYIWYVVSSIKLYYKTRFHGLSEIMGFSIVLGTLGYMISGLANDSTIAIAPIFWVMMGIGIALNQRIQNTKYPSGQ